MKRRRRLVILAILAIAGAVVAISFYQPPMRLIPPPAAFLDARAAGASGDPAQSFDPRIEIFYATNRLALGPADSRLYAVVPGLDLHLGRATLRIGDDSTTWMRIYEWSTGQRGDRRPYLHLETLRESAAVAADGPPTPEALAWFAEIDRALAASRDKDVIIYVHGANSTIERAAGQAAQILHFSGRNAVVLLFAWPTAETFLRYSRDMVTAFGAAPHLARLVELLAAHTAAERIDILTYSAGATVGSNGLAIVGRHARQAGAPPPRLGAIYHAAPDADFRSFVADLKDYAGQARQVTVAANLGDSALLLSRVVNRASRAGRPDMAELDADSTAWLLEASASDGLELLRVRPEDIPGLSPRSHSFWYDDPWVSSDVLITLLFHLTPADRGLAEAHAAAGTHYWQFTPDYPQRLSDALTLMRTR